MLTSRPRSDEYDKNGYDGLPSTEGGHQESVNLNRNVTARYSTFLNFLFMDLRVDETDRIQNPLAGIPRATLLKNVEDFANEVGMADHIPLIQRGALVAQNPPAFEQLEELDDLEKDALRNEVLHKWRQPWPLYFTVILCSIGAAVQGWDQTGSNGANLTWPSDFGVPNEGPEATDYNTWIVGIVNAGPYIGSAVL
ncbi:MAG: hypothetical protein L6R41_007620 [Letrouitia leprolyta]|nr:MAG: hypothetical protein L6R41_007620 [Letrouitia leprolyta]